MRKSLCILTWILAVPAWGQALLVDLNTTTEGSGPRQLTVVGDNLFFTAEPPASDREVFVWTEAEGARRLEHATAGALMGDANILGSAGDRVFFKAPTVSSSTEQKIWSSNGTDLHDLGDFGSVSPGFALNGRYTFLATATSGRRLYITDGTKDGTALLFEGPVIEDVADRGYGTMVRDGLLYFAASRTGSENMFLWSTDGTDQGTFQLGSMGTSNGRMALLGDAVIYFPNDRPEGPQLRSIALDGSDGQQVSQVGAAGSRIVGFAIAGDKVFFVAEDEALGWEMHVSDGTPAGTSLLVDINPGPGNSWPEEFFPFREGMVFQARSDATGKELWFTDGTPAGTRMLGDIIPGPLSTRIQALAIRDGLLYFCAEEYQHGMELWVSDGTEAGTRLLNDLVPGPESSVPEFAAFMGSRLLLGLYQPETGRELYSLSLDGQLRLEADLGGDGHGLSRPAEFVSDGMLVSFVASDGRSGSRVWLSDGSASGTRPVPGSSAILGPASAPQFSHGALYWRTTRGIWRYDPATGETKSREFDRVYKLAAVTPEVLVSQSGPRVDVLDAVSLASLYSMPGTHAAAAGDGTVFAIEGDQIVTWHRASGTGTGGRLPPGHRPYRDAFGASTDYYFQTSDSTSVTWLWRSDGSQVYLVGDEPVDFIYDAISVGEGLLFALRDGIMAAGPDGVTLVAPEGVSRSGLLQSGDQIHFLTQSSSGATSLWVTTDAFQGSQRILTFPGDSYDSTLQGLWNGVPVLSLADQEGRRRFALAEGGGLVPVGDSFESSRIRSAAISGDELLFMGPDSELWVLTVSTPTGEQHPSVLTPTLSVYPNPAKGQVTVDAPEDAKLEVFDLLGRHVATWNGAPGGGDAVLDVSAWPVGVYAVRISMDRATSVRMLSVVR
jgi:ELWxxDGT repeat protein